MSELYETVRVFWVTACAQAAMEEQPFVKRHYEGQASAYEAVLKQMQKLKLAPPPRPKSKKRKRVRQVD